MKASFHSFLLVLVILTLCFGCKTTLKTVDAPKTIKLKTIKYYSINTDISADAPYQTTYTYYNTSNQLVRLITVDSTGRHLMDLYTGSWDKLEKDSDSKLPRTPVKKQQLTKNIAGKIRFLDTNEDNYIHNNTFFPEIISKSNIDESSVSFTRDGKTIFFTRTENWTDQTPFLGKKIDGVFQVVDTVKAIGTIYNGAISRDGSQLLYSVKTDSTEVIWWIQKEGEQWGAAVNLSTSSGIYGGYFYWIDAQNILFYVNEENGNIVKGQLSDGRLVITDKLEVLNTEAGTEFSPFISPDQRYLIFTRYTPGDVAQQGFFISYNRAKKGWNWTTPEKITTLEYGWSATVMADQSQFIYTNGIDVKAVPLQSLGLKRIKK